MDYGCIGERLKHSFSKQIHNSLSDYNYDLVELSLSELDVFMQKKDFKAINVTIPYKETVIPYLTYIDEGARLIGAVNTIVNREGKLYGYNTDFPGMIKLIDHAGIKIQGKKVLILGTGGTSKTAYAVSKHLGARQIIKAGRCGKEGSLLYEDVLKSHTDSEIIINTTPVGMFPDIYGEPIDIELFPNLSGVIDAVYNPLRTPLISKAKRLSIPAEGGLYMLVAQGVIASEIFLDTRYDDATFDRVYGEIYRQKSNIVLIGMPASGKSTVGKILADRMSRELIDTDELIEKRAGMSIPEIFDKLGEGYFRDLESLVIKEVSSMVGVIISTGGGAVLREENVYALRENGRIYFIDRPLDSLCPTSDRPLSSNLSDMKKRYEERYCIYKSSADKRIDAKASAAEVADLIDRDFSLST